MDDVRGTIDELHGMYVRALRENADWDEDEALEDVMDYLASNELTVAAIADAGLATKALGAVSGEFGAVIASGDLFGSYIAREPEGFELAKSSLRDMQLAYADAVEDGLSDVEAVDAAFACIPSDVERLRALWGAGLIGDGFLAVYSDLKGAVMQGTFAADVRKAPRNPRR